MLTTFSFQYFWSSYYNNNISTFLFPLFVFLFFFFFFKVLNRLQMKHKKTLPRELGFLFFQCIVEVGIGGFLLMPDSWFCACFRGGEGGDVK